MGYARLPVRRPLLRELTIFAGFLAASIVLTWPLAPHFLTDIGGDLGDHWQTLWGYWWVRKALLDLHQSPFWSNYVHWPLGMPLVFQTFDLPDCILTIPLWSFLPPVAVFNCAELWSYPLGGYFFYRLALELLREHAPAPPPGGPSDVGVDRGAAIVAGALFTFAPYHFGHALGHMHIVALEWVPLYFWMLVRTLDRPERRWPVLAGLALVLASTASWYHLLFCVALTFPYLAYRAATDPAVRSWATLRRAFLLGGVYLAVMWPLFAQMLEARGADAWDGAHDPRTFSADLMQFFVPNAAQSLGFNFRDQWSLWSGNPAENCNYLGYALMALAIIGAVRDRRARFFLAMVPVGIVLALGPALKIGGRPIDVPLPYDFLTRIFPLLEFTGVPVRAGFVAIFALAAAAAFGLRELWLGFHRMPWRLPLRVLAVALLLMATIELYPHPFAISRFPIPTIFASWAADTSVFGVVDYTGDTRPLYNGVLHQHPMVDVYLSRTPMHLLSWLDNHPILGRLRHGRGGSLEMSKDEGRALLQREHIRYFVLPSWRREPLLEQELELPVVYVGEGVRVFEVPGA
jgi:hypothetical protein